MTNEVKPNYRHFDKQEDKPFFAAYFNTALQNAHICLRDICARTGLGFDDGQDGSLDKLDLWEKLTANKEPELTQRIIGLLHERFPFTKHLAAAVAHKKHRGSEPTPENYRHVCIALLKQLYQFRNYYSHVGHPLYEVEEGIINFMRLLFDAARPLVKERFSLATEAVDHLVRRGKDGKEIAGFKYAFSTKDIALTEKGLAFFACLWLQRKQAQAFLKKLHGFKRSESPSQQATLEVFTNYGLHLPQPRLTSDTSSAGLLLDMVNELKRCPARLYPLLSNEDRDTFAALPEEEEYNSTEEEYEAMPVLKRSSNRFYYFALRFLEQRCNILRFEADLGNYCYHSYEKEIGDVSRTRRWIKRMTAFGRLEDFAGERPPHWQDKILTLAERNSADASVYVTDTTPHYHINNYTIGMKIQQQPDYDAAKANGRLWPALPPYDGEGQKGPAGNRPDLWLSLYELPAIVFYSLLQQQHPKLPAAEQVILAHYNKMRSFFEDIASGKLTGDVYTSATLNALLKERGLERQQIPKAILQYLESRQQPAFAARAERLLKALIQETETRTKKLEVIRGGVGQRPGSKNHIPLKNGHIADFLARDLLLLQPALDAGKGKANGTAFQVLQASLAYFAVNKPSLPGLFAHCNLTGSHNPHPFLAKIDLERCRGLLDFYDAYLQQRMRYLSDCLQKKNYDQYHFLKLSREKRNPADMYIIGLAKKMCSEVVANLPRGLFLQPLLTLLRADKAGAVVAAEADALPRVNVAWLIDAYFRQVRQDGPQEFYSYGRAYELLDKIYDTRSAKAKREQRPRKYHTPAQLADLQQELMQKLREKTIRDYKNGQRKKPAIPPTPLTPQEKETGISEANWRAYKQFTEDEKDIRWNRVCDMVLFMMADDLLRKEFLTDGGKLKKKGQATTVVPEIQLGEGYTLRAIRPRAKNDILSLQTTVSLSMHYQYETNMDNIRFVKGAVSVPSAKQYKTMIQAGIKIKNYGDFRGLLKDRHISSLLPYIAATEVQVAALRQELDWYEEVRIKVFEKVQAFERMAIGDRSHNEQYKHTDLLLRYLSEEDLRFAELRQLRNAFSHSLYPDWLLFKDRINGQEFNTLQAHTTAQPMKAHSIAWQLWTLVNTYYDDLLLATGPTPQQQ
jgi:hypothetical protein